MSEPISIKVVRDDAPIPVIDSAPLPSQFPATSL